MKKGDAPSLRVHAEEIKVQAGTSGVHAEETKGEPFIKGVHKWKKDTVAAHFGGLYHFKNELKF